MTRHHRILLALTTALVLPCAAAADEVTDQMGRALRAYEAGELRTAVETLNFVVAKIQERITGQLLKLLPEPLSGWKADPPESQSGGLATMLTGSTLSRRYFRDDGAEVQLNLMVDSPMLPMLTMALSMPFVMQSNQDLKPYAFRDYRGTLEHTADSQEYEVSLMVGSRILIQVKGSGIPDQTPVEQYLEALDLKAIAQSLTN